MLESAKKVQMNANRSQKAKIVSVTSKVLQMFCQLLRACSLRSQKILYPSFLHTRVFELFHI